MLILFCFRFGTLRPMESRKRPHVEEEATFTAKKRVLSDTNGSPHVNGGVLDQEEPAEGDNIELFRKEAIFRRMRHYSRENERSQSRIAELERRKNTCEAGLAAISACWNQLVDTIRLLLNPEEFPEVRQDVFNFALSNQDDSKTDFGKVLEDNMRVTQSLVTQLAEMNGDSRPRIGQEDALRQCQKVTSECVALRSQVDVMRVKLEDSEMQRDKYHVTLVATENRLDRLRSGTVLKMQSRGAMHEQEPKEEVIEEPQRKPSSPARSKSPPQGDGIRDQTEVQILQEQLKTREIKIRELEKEAALLRDEKTLLEADLQLIPLEKIGGNPYYKVLLDHCSALEATIKENREQITRLSDEVGALRASRKEWEESIMAATGHATQELKGMLSKRDVENARLRDQREQQAAELNERKHKDNVKLASLQELKALAESRSERISVLESELRRYKAQLAAHAGNEDLMLFFADGNIENAAYLESLKNRLTVAEDRAAALEQTLSHFQNDHPKIAEHMKAEVDACQQLSVVKVQLEKYKTVYGDPSTLPLDASKLMEQLQQKEEENQRLRLLDTQRSQAETSLYAELDKISAAWEALDRQVKNKVFDLSNMEERLTKSGLDRAKSENKFYAAMRDKEAVEAERKNLARNAEKQAKLIDKLMDTERNLTNQLSALDKESVALKKSIDAHRERVIDLEREISQAQARADAEKQRMEEMRTFILAREQIIEQRRAELRKLEDGLIRSKKELEQRSKEITLSSTSSQGYSEREGLLRILKCSTCHMNFRNTVILKCMHTFCKECVDARISTRQRKCPGCNLAFAQSDVQQIFFQ